MKKIFLPVALAACMAALPIHQAQAGSINGADSGPTIVVPNAGPATSVQPEAAGAPKPAKDANAMIDAGAAKAKAAAAKLSAWVAKKKAEHDAKKAAAAAQGQPGVVVPAPAQ